MLESDSVASKNCCCHKICLCAWVVILYIVFHVCSLSSSEVNIGCMVLVRNFRCDLRILSDANQFFIEKILEHHGLLGCFSKIYTNPSFVDEEGRLRILPYYDSTLSPHGCSLCPSNLCKVNKFTD